MFIELVEFLRCPRAHEESYLVASATSTVDRHIVNGLLGCPVCGAEFPIRDGVATFDPDVTAPAAAEPSMDEAMRIAAFLELTDARGFALLCGTWGAHAGPLGELVRTPVVLVNAPPAPAAGVIQVARRLPFASGTARAAAVHATQPPELVHAILAVVRGGGRLMGTADTPVPEGVREIARDARAWVGEKIAAPDPAPRLVTLKRTGR